MVYKMIHNVGKCTFWRAPSEDSSQPAQPHSLMRGFCCPHEETASLASQNAPGDDSDQTVNAQADLIHCCAHMSAGTFSDVAAQINP